MTWLRRTDNPPARRIQGASHRRLAAFAVFTIVASAALADGEAERGRQVFASAGGCGCHTAPDGPIGAGGGEVPTPFGRFYGTNVTPDTETGIGSWSDAEIAAAVRDGWRRGGGAESPAMPYYRYAGMADQDVADLIAYLRMLTPVRRQNREHEVILPLPRLAYRAWRLLFFSATGSPASAPTEAVARGRYLVNHVAICGDCHTPRNRLGAEDASRYLAGTADGPAGARVPNLTPHRTGIGDWDESDIVGVLTLGMLPNFDNVQGLMAEVVDGKAGSPAYKDAARRDLEAIAAYLKTVPPIDNDVPKKTP